MNKFTGAFSAATMALFLVGCGDPGDMDGEDMQDRQQDPMQQQQQAPMEQQDMDGQPQGDGYEFEDQQDDRDQDGDW